MFATHNPTLQHSFDVILGIHCKCATTPWSNSHPADSRFAFHVWCVPFFFVTANEPPTTITRASCMTSVICIELCLCLCCRHSRSDFAATGQKSDATQTTKQSAGLVMMRDFAGRFGHNRVSERLVGGCWDKTCESFHINEYQVNCNDLSFPFKPLLLSARRTAESSAFLLIR